MKSFATPIRLMHNKNMKRKLWKACQSNVENWAKPNKLQKNVHLCVKVTVKKVSKPFLLSINPHPSLIISSLAELFHLQCVWKIINQPWTQKDLYLSAPQPSWKNWTFSYSSIFNVGPYEPLFRCLSFPCDPFSRLLAACARKFVPKVTPPSTPLHFYFKFLGKWLRVVAAVATNVKEFSHYHPVCFLILFPS